MSGNKSFCDQLSSLKSLKKLNLNCCSLTEIPERLVVCPQLPRLELPYSTDLILHPFTAAVDFNLDSDPHKVHADSVTHNLPNYMTSINYYPHAFYVDKVVSNKSW